MKQEDHPGSVNAVLPGTEITPFDEIKAEIISYQQADADTQKSLQVLVDEINVTDRNSILFFGSAAQEQMSKVSETMLEGVRNKDIGPAGGSLSDMLLTLKGFDVEKLAPHKKPGFFARLLGLGRPVVKFLQRYDQVKEQVNEISDRLEGHKMNLLTDIVRLDKLFDSNLEYYHQLEQYISAGQEKLRLLDQDEIPSLAEEVASQSNDLVLAQNLSDLRSARNDLERRVHDLQLTRQVAMQSLPSIRLVQDNDKTLVNKINSTLVNTVPLWKNQLAQAVTIFRMGEAADAVKEATDLTNELLEQNAENLREHNAEVRRQNERGVFDIASVKKANQSLIATINDSLKIAEEGKTARAKANIELQAMEKELKQALVSAKARVE